MVERMIAFKNLIDRLSGAGYVYFILSSINGPGAKVPARSKVAGKSFNIFFWRD
jgi:hypothetical protein